MLCDSSNLNKQKLVKPKPLASKMAAVKKVGQKNGEVGLLVEYLFCDTTDFHFFTMMTCPKRVRNTAEDVLDVLKERNEFDSDRGGLSSGEESDIDRQLMNFDELMRCV